MIPQEAKNTMLLVFKQAWDATGFQAVYEDTQTVALQNTWARAIVRHADGRQSSLADSNGVRLYESVGTLWIEIRCPRGTGGTQGYQLGNMVMSAFKRAKSGALWYRRIRMSDPMPDGAFELTQVLVDFTYPSTE